MIHAVILNATFAEMYFHSENRRARQYPSGNSTACMRSCERFFIVAQEEFANILLEKCDQKRSNPPLNVICGIGSECAPNLS